ncbi:MAG TPA: hypothetical protein VF060_31255 [Trebonia sp.]
MLTNTRAQALLAEVGDRLEPLTDLLTRVASHPAGNRGFAETITGLDTRYDMLPDTGHPWLGRLAPNLALSIGTDDTDLATLLGPGRGVLLDLAEDDDLRRCPEGWAERVEFATAICPGHPELRAILLRPDGHTAWLSTASDDPADGACQALQRWHGPATRPAPGRSRKKRADIPYKPSSRMAQFGHVSDNSKKKFSDWVLLFWASCSAAWEWCFSASCCYQTL